MNYREKESFVKSFALFFVTLFSMGALALGFYSHEQQRFYRLQLLTEMDAFSYVLHGRELTYTVIPMNTTRPIHDLIVTDHEVYALFPWVKNPNKALVKVSYPYKNYQASFNTERHKLWMLFAALGIMSGLLSALFARYTLRPMRRSLALMEDFLKDIIHDLNTPVASILLNTQLLNRHYPDEEIGRIALGAQTIHALSKNLEALYRDLPLGEESICIGDFLRERVDYFRHLYPDLTWDVQGDDGALRHINRELLIRIVDNLLANAGKYNRRGGSVRIAYDTSGISITDTGTGIRKPDKAFDRFYRESERGLGIGLHIVKTFAQKGGIDIILESTVGRGTRVELRFN